MRRLFPLVSLALLILLATACAGQQPAPTPTATAIPPAPTATATPVPPAPTPTPTTTAMAAPHGDVVLALHELSGSGQTGIAVLTAQGDKTEVALMATPGISQANHIHTGGCLGLGGVSYPLTDMQDGRSVTVVNTKLDSLLTGAFAINLHKAGAPTTYTSCADIPAKADVVMVKLNEQNTSGQSGIASLVAQGDKTEVVLYATAGVSQANHIHTGSCSTLGGVAYALTNMKDGWSVTMVAAKLADLTKGGMAINLHKATDAKVYTACGDIPAMNMGSQTTMMGPHGDLVIALKEKNTSGQTGIAVLTANGDKTEVVLMATPGKSKANHIHTGDCTTLGGVAHALTDMSNGQSTTMVNASLDSLLKGGFAINLHDAGNPGVYTSCGEIPAKGNFVTVALKEKTASGQSGIASLVAQGDKTEVVLYATPGVSQANHIHTGDCTTLGGVKYPLTNMLDGMSFTSVAAKLADLTVGGLAINLHKATDAKVYTACGEIPMVNMGSQTTMMGPRGDVVLALKEKGGSGQTGIAVLTANGDKTEVVLMATQGKSKANHIHTGDCTTLGGVKYPLTDMSNGQSTTVVAATLDSLLAGGFAINLHKVDDAKVYTSCGDIPSKGNFVTVALKEKNASGQTGIASLIAKGESTSTDVALYATPGVSQANHIHTGDCTTLGGVKYPLANMLDGVSVTSVAAKLADLTAGGLAINLHKATDAKVYTACGDIPKAGTSGSTSGGATTKVIQGEIKNFALPSLSVAAGTTVTWAQMDVEGHTITSSAGLWDSGILPQGKTFSYSFTKAGSYNYKCTLHSGMNATVMVTDLPSTSVIDTNY